LEFLTTLVGFAALGTTAFGFTIREDRLLQKVNLAGCVLWMAHFGMLGALVASGMMLLAIVMIGSAVLKIEKVSVWAWRGNLALLPLVALAIMLGLLEPGTFAPVLAGFLINTGVARCTGWKMTALVALGAALWATTGLIEGSWPAIAANVLNLCALTLRAAPMRAVAKEVSEVDEVEAA
jgi:hypothetical protein